MDFVFSVYFCARTIKKLNMKKKNGLLMTLLAGSLMMTSCGSVKKTAAVVDLAGEWEIVEVDNKPISSEEIPFLGFNVKEGQLYGNTGCNSLMATIQLGEDAGDLSFDAVGSTKRMCADMTTEDAILQTLGAVKGFTLEGGKLMLNNADGKELMELKKRP